MAKRPRTSRKDTLKEIGLVIGGGLVEILVENLADMYLPPYSIIPGAQPYNTGDAVGALEATLVTLVGVKKDNKKAKLFGAGGLAVAVPNLVGKAVVNTMTPTLRLGNMSSFGSQGRYGRTAPVFGSTVPAFTPTRRR